MKTTVISVIFLLIIGALWLKTTQLNQEITGYKAKTELLVSVRDSVHFYKDKYGREVGEKRVIEADLKQVKAVNTALSTNQKLLVKEIEAVGREKNKKVVGAISITQKVGLHVVDTVQIASKYQHAWQHVSDTLNYNIYVQDSTLTIDNLSLPNRLTLINYRDKEKLLHVQVTNENPAFKTNDIDQIIMEKPEKKSLLLKILYFVGGVAVGRFI